MGPKLISFRGKPIFQDGQRTLYSLRLLPIGGFCKMRGEDKKAAEDLQAGTSFDSKRPLQRLYVLVNGAFYNILLAFILFFYNISRCRIPYIDGLVCP